MAKKQAQITIPLANYRLIERTMRIRNWQYYAWAYPPHESRWAVAVTLMSNVWFEVGTGDAINNDYLTRI